MISNLVCSTQTYGEFDFGSVHLVPYIYICNCIFNVIYKIRAVSRALLSLFYVVVFQWGIRVTDLPYCMIAECQRSKIQICGYHRKLRKHNITLALYIIIVRYCKYSKLEMGHLFTGYTAVQSSLQPVKTHSPGVVPYEGQ